MKKILLSSFLFFLFFCLQGVSARPGSGNSFSSGKSSGGEYSSSSSAGTNWTIPVSEDAVIQPGGLVFIIFIFGVVFSVVFSMNLGSGKKTVVNIAGLFIIHALGIFLFLLEISMWWGIFYYILIPLLSLGAYKGQRLENQKGVAITGRNSKK